MDSGRQHIGKTLQRQRGFMRDHPLALAPKPGGDQLLVLAERIMNDAVDATAYSRDPTGLLMVGQERRRIACGVSGITRAI